MAEPLESLQRERDRLARRLARERSARSQAEEIAERAIGALSATNREYETFFNLSPNLFCTADRTLHFRELSPSWEQVLGWSLDELRARPFPEFVHPDDLAPTQREAGRLLEGSSITVGFKNRYRHKDGSWVWLSWSARVAHGVFYAEAIDVSARERAEAALIESEARARAILDSAVDAILTIDEGGILRDMNPATEKMFGYRPDELRGRNVSTLMPVPDRERHDDYIRSYLETGLAKVIGIGRETVAQRRDGSTFPIDLTVGEVRLGKRRLFTGIIRDITDRKTALRRLEETLRDLARSRDDLLTVLNELRAGTLLIGRDDRIAFLSERWEQLAWDGLPTAAGRPWDEVLPLDRSGRDALRAMLRTDPSRRTRMNLAWRAAASPLRRVEIDLRDDPRDAASHIALVYDVTEVQELRARLAASSHGRLIGSCAPMRTLYEQISQVAQGDWTVLIEGETGVGKELVARAIHTASARQGAPFVAVNCAGLTDTLLESQLFGHRKGAFTGAVADQQGLFEAATGGTIFLDEIGDISTKLQSTLLRVLQEREILRVGDIKARSVDLRIIAATNKDLAREAAAGRFREDLLYRIRVARILVPPLRQRGEDIAQLASAFLDEQRLASGKPTLQLHRDAVETLQRYRWPGNVRELRSAIEFAAMRCAGKIIAARDLPPEIESAWQQPANHAEPSAAGSPAPPPSAAAIPASPLPESVALPPWPPTVAPSAPAQAPDDERARIRAALEWAEGNRARAARRLGISRATFYRRLVALGIPAKRPRARASSSLHAGKRRSPDPT